MKDQDKTKAQLIAELEELRARVCELEQNGNEHGLDADTIQERELHLREAQRVAHIGSFEGDIHQDKLWWSDEHYHLFGLDPKSFVPTKGAFFELLHPDDRDEYIAAIIHSVKSGENLKGAYRVKHTNGEWRHFETRAEVVFDENGEVFRLRGTVQDISERVEMEEELRKSEERFRTLYEDNPSMYFIVDANGIVLSVNTYGAGQLGYRVGELVGQPVLNVFYPDDKTAVTEQLKACFAKPDQVAHWVFRKVRKDGSMLWVREAVRVVKDFGGKQVVFVVCEDITEHKQGEEALTQSLKTLQEERDIFTGGPAVIFKWQNLPGWPVEYVSANVETVFGYTAEDFLSGQVSYEEIISKDDLDRVAGEVRANSESGANKFTHQPYRITRKDGQTAWLSDHTAIVRNTQGEVTYHLGYVVDISEQKKSEQQIQSHLLQTEHLQQTIENLNHAQSLDEIYKAAGEGILKTLKADRYSILLFEEDRKVHFKSWHNLSKIYRQKVDGHCPWQIDETDAQPIIYDDVAKSDLSRELKEIILAEGIRAVRFIPLKCPDCLLGKFMVYCDQPHPWADEELQIAQVIAQNLAAVILRQQALDETQRAEQKYRSIFENAAEGIYQTTPQGKFIMVNPALVKIFGYKSAEEMLAIENTADLYWDAGERQKLSEIVARHGVLAHAEVKMRRIDGTLVWVVMNDRAVKDSKGKTLYFEGMILDITERKRAEEALRKWADIFKIAQWGIVIGSADGNTLEMMNPAYAQMYGYTVEEMTGTAILDVFAPEVRALVPEYVRKANELGYYTFESKHIRKNNEVFPVSISAQVVKDDKGEILYRVVNVIDITERKKAEKTLRESEERLRKIFEYSNDAIYLIDPEQDKIIDVNPAACSLVKYSRDELLSLPVSAIHPDDLFPLSNLVQLVFDEGSGWTDKLTCLAKTGERIQVEVSASVLEFKGRNCMLALVRDISERKRAEEALQRNEEKYRKIFENVRDIFYQTDYHGTITEISPSVERHGGYTRDGLIGTQIADLYFYSGDYVELCTQLKKDGEVNDFEVRLKEKDGRLAYGSVNARVIFDIDGNPVASEGTLRNITERKQAEEELKESETKYKGIATSIPGVVFQFAVKQDGSYTFPYIGESYEKFFQQKAKAVEADPSLFFDMIPAEELPSFIDSIEESNRTLKEWRHDFRVILPDGQERWFEGRSIPHLLPSGLPLWNGVVTDITESKHAEEENAKLEEQLRRSQKLETIGTLAGGIAHDFNNILTPIMGYTDLALSDSLTDSRLREDLENILKGAMRAKDLVEQILLFSRQVEKERQPVSLHIIVKEALKLLRPSIPTTIEIRQRIDASCDKVMADASQIHQVIVNLCTNAWQAMEAKGGVLTIELKQVELDDSAAKLHHNLDEGEYVRLSVIDTGCGMDDKTLDRIFEPFFSTKAVDKGTGMGLAVVHGIVRSHHGDILVYSEQGRGSTFQVYLPTAKAEDRAVGKKSEAIARGRESILIADDDDTVATVVQRMLKHLGYAVDVRNSGLEALKAFRQQPDKYDLVISDLTMPNLTGLQLSEQLRKVRSELSIIIMTGYGDILTKDTQETYGIKNVIGKPVVMHELASAIRVVLDK